MSLFSTALGAKGIYDQMQDIKDLQKRQQAFLSELTPQVTAQTQFKPFTVASSIGSVQATPEGGFTTNLSPEQQALQSQLFGGAGQFLSQAQQPIAQTEQDIFNRMLQVAAPERQRQQLGLEERLAAQGRLGTSSAAYGGATPEQMALATAQQEQLNQLGLSARQQALAEQAQAAGLGTDFMTAGYMPQSQMLNMLSPAVNLSNIVSTGDREAAGLMSQLGLGGLGMESNLEAQRSGLMGDLYGTVAQATQGLSGTVGSGSYTGNPYIDAGLKFLFG
jgi:hypothetical protein